MEVAASTVVDRPISTVWNFYALHHVENHPRWDPNLELEKLSQGPVGLGTVIRRWNRRYDPPTEGTMEVVEFEAQKVMGVKIQDGPIETRGRATLSVITPTSTRIEIWVEFPGMDDSMAEQIKPMIERSAATIKGLIESES